MSADAWRICPQCLSDSQKKRAKEIEDVNKSYGKVPPEEWLGMKANIEEAIEMEETLREDYGIETDKAGRFYVSYECSCSTCGFKHSFKHEEQLEVKP